MRKLQEIDTIWSVLGDVEALSKKSMNDELAPWEQIVRTCIEAGILAPTIPAKNHGHIQLSSAAPFLKRSLNDLRCIWLLVEMGHTPQAACIAASLYENALTAAVIASSEVLAKKAMGTKYAEIPWSAKELAQLDSQREIAIQEKSGKKVSTKEYEDAWTISYFHYKWLCQIKHPTWQSVYHDVKSAAVENHEFAVLPIPNNLPEDMQVKASILGGSIAKTLQAIKAFFLALECDEDSKEYEVFEDKVNKVHFGVLEMMKKHQGKDAPITVLNTSFIKTDFSTLRKYDQ